MKTCNLGSNDIEVFVTMASQRPMMPRYGTRTEMGRRWTAKERFTYDELLRAGTECSFCEQNKT
jgi:hypothetical protein